MKVVYTIEEKTLVQGCIQGDSLAQEKLYKRFASKMFGVCLGYAKDHDTAKDLLQEGFIKVFKSISKYDGTGSLEGWIRRTIVNNSIDYFRRETRQKQKFDLAREEIKEEQSAESNLAIKSIEVEEFLQLIQDLPEGYRLVLNLYIIEGYSHKDIAEQLNISIGTSKSQLAKAKKYIMKLLPQFVDNEILSNYEKRSS